MLSRIEDGRTDLVFEYLAAGNPADESLMGWCAYYGDVSAIKHLLANGASLEWPGNNLGLNSAAFHGHWRLCEFLIEHGAKVNQPEAESGETPLHAALTTTNALARNVVLKLLLTHGGNPNCRTKESAENRQFHAGLPHQR